MLTEKWGIGWIKCKAMTRADPAKNYWGGGGIIKIHKRLGRERFMIVRSFINCCFHFENENVQNYTNYI